MGRRRGFETISCGQPGESEEKVRVRGLAEEDNLRTRPDASRVQGVAEEEKSRTRPDVSREQGVAENENVPWRPDASRVRWADMSLDSDEGVEIPSEPTETERVQYRGNDMDVNDMLDGCAGGEASEVEVYGEHEFNPEELRKAREEELACFTNIDLYEEVAIQDDWRAAHRIRVTTEKVDVVKDSDGQRTVRSILLARTFKAKSDRREDRFATTPPLETLKSLLIINSSIRTLYT